MELLLLAARATRAGRRRALGAAACLGLAAAAIASCLTGPAQAQSELLAAVESARPEIRAQLRAPRSTTLASGMAGRIDFLELRDGDRFEEGQVLVRFDCEAVQYNAAIARALRNKAAKVYENKRRLGQLGSIAALDIDVAAADLAQASAEVDLAEERLSRCEIKAPFPGITAEVPVKRYQYVNEGEPLMQILDDRELEVEMLLPSIWLLYLDVGERFGLTLDETGKTYEATLVRFSGRIDAVSQTIKAYGRVEGDNPELLAGMSGRASFPQVP